RIAHTLAVWAEEKRVSIHFIKWAPFPSIHRHYRLVAASRDVGHVPGVRADGEHLLLGCPQGVTRIDLPQRYLAGCQPDALICCKGGGRTGRKHHGERER